MSNTINISTLNKAAVLAALFNNARQQGMGRLVQRGSTEMTMAQAEEMIGESADLYFDYLHGRVLKIDLRGVELHTGLYDRDNGHGAAECALAPLLAAAEA